MLQSNTILVARLGWASGLEDEFEDSTKFHLKNSTSASPKYILKKGTGRADFQSH